MIRLAPWCSRPASARACGPLTDTLPKPLVQVAGKALIDHVLDRLADAGVDAPRWSTCTTSPTRSRAHLKGRTRPKIEISDERGELLDTGGGVVKALPRLGDAPFFHMNSDTRVDRGRDAEPGAARRAVRSRPAWTSCCCSPRPRPASAMRGAAISPWRRTDGSRAAPSARSRRSSMRAPRSCRRRMFADAPTGEVLAQPHVRPRDRGRAAAWPAPRRHLDACRHARRRSRRPRRRSWRAWRSVFRRISRRKAMRAGFRVRAGGHDDSGCAPYNGAMSPRVFTIPASAPFLPTLIRALQRGELIAGFPTPPIRWRSRMRRCSCRRGAPARSRARRFSMR